MQSNRNDLLITIRPEVYIILACSALLLPLGWVLAWITAAAIHELFHYTALKVCRCRISRIQIGANGTCMDADTMTYGKEAFCAVAGPLAGLVLLFAARWLPKVAICGFIQSMYNLLPIFPMDGGRVVRSLLRKLFDLRIADSICWWIERIILCVLGGICLYFSFVISLGPIPLVWMAVLLLKNKLTNSPCKDALLRVQ